MKINDVQIAIEKESLVYKENWDNANFKLDDLHPQMEIDFANNQMEIISSINDCEYCLTRELKSIQNQSVLQNKIIWPFSIAPTHKQVYNYDLKDYTYRKYLLDKYGQEKMLMSGIHYNYSNDLLKTQADYFDLLKKSYEFLPILIQFISFSPYLNENLLGLEKFGNSYGLKDAISLRNSIEYGYSNEQFLELQYHDLNVYNTSIEDAVDNNLIINNREVYSKIRLKDGYIELRAIDLNPFSKVGITKDIILLIKLFFNYLSKTENIIQVDEDNWLKNIDLVTLKGQDKTNKLIINNQDKTIHDHTVDFLNILIEKECYDESEKDVINKLKMNYINNKLDINTLIEGLADSQYSYDKYYPKIKKLNNNDKFALYPNLKMELSTKLIIKEAEKRGYQVEIESESDNIIKVSHNNHFEYIIQGSKTNSDTYANVLLMNNKYMTKKILDEVNINTPKGILINKDSKLDLDLYLNKDVVIKPLDTNFGQGIKIFKVNNILQLEKEIKKSLEDQDVLILEEYIKGEEFRFLVIDNQLVSILTRKNASVIADGIHSIEKLIEIKNHSSMRGTNYQKPLEKIIIDDDLLNNLKEKNYQLSDVIKRGEKINLRKASNVSQGGDTHEVLEKIPDFYKKIALQAAKQLNVKITGIDMIIDMDRINENNYSILEANFNPALHIHTFPYKGIGKNVAENILDLLFEKL